MRDLAGKTVVITGGASGMGRSFAFRFGQAGMKVVVADIEEPVLDATVTELIEAGHTAVGVVADVSDEDSVQALADRASDQYGPVHLICLNAGVGGGNRLLHTVTATDWQWVLGVNLWGIIHGLSHFLPGMVARGEGHVVITASIAGHISAPSMGPYNATKHAAVAIAETLYAENAVDQGNIGVTCLCPGFVMTNIFSSERNRPEQLGNPLIPEPISDDDQERIGAIIELIAANAKSPDMVADLVHDAVVDDHFWVFTDSDFDARIGRRMDSIRTKTNPEVGGDLFTVYD